MHSTKSSSIRRLETEQGCLKVTHVANSLFGDHSGANIERIKRSQVLGLEISLLKTRVESNTRKGMPWTHHGTISQHRSFTEMSTDLESSPRRFLETHCSLPNNFFTLVQEPIVVFVIHHRACCSHRGQPYCIDPAQDLELFNSEYQCHC